MGIGYLNKNSKFGQQNKGKHIKAVVEYSWERDPVKILSLIVDEVP